MPAAPALLPFPINARFRDETMRATAETREPFSTDTFEFYWRALEALRGAEVPFLVGGAYAFGCYTGIARHTKDLDIFLRAADAKAATDALNEAGYRTEIVFSHWLAKEIGRAHV